MNTERIAIGARIGHSPDPAFFVSWTALIRKGLRDDDKVLLPAVEMPHACACNTIVERFLATDCTALLFVDDDMVFTADALERLRETDTDASIVSALYNTRRAPFMPIALRKAGKQFAAVMDLGEIVKVDVVGLGFTLFSREVMENAAKNRPGAVFRWDDDYGEDGGFCLWAGDNGHKIIVNPHVKVGHRVTFTANWNTITEQVEMDFESFGLRPRTTNEKGN